MSRSTKASVAPAFARLVVPAPGSKSVVPLKDPVTYTRFEASVVMPTPRSAPVLPTPLTHCRAPASLSLSTKMSVLPALVRFVAVPPGLKFTTPVYWPVTSTLLALSTAMP